MEFIYLCVCVCFMFVIFVFSWGFIDVEQRDGEDLTIDYYDDLYCPACDKSFKSDKS